MSFQEKKNKRDNLKKKKRLCLKKKRKEKRSKGCLKKIHSLFLNNKQRDTKLKRKKRTTC